MNVWGIQGVGPSMSDDCMGNLVDDHDVAPIARAYPVHSGTAEPR
jgi:hypothetical protein